MDLGLTGKTALVTGSGQGIGLAIAKVLHQEGSNIALNARHEKAIATTAKCWVKRVSYHVADVTQPEECRSLVDKVVERWEKTRYLSL